jgi:uncharacterized protein YndB with AHSA1/START domain
MNIEKKKLQHERKLPEIDYGSVTGPDSVQLEIDLPGPVERVWEYLTDSEKRGKWLATGPMELREGGRVELRWNHADLSVEKDPPEECRKYEGHISRGKVLRCEPPRLLVFTWGDSPEDASGESDSVVTFELTSRGDRVLFSIIHSRLGSRDKMVSVSGGWHAHASILLDRLAGRETRGFWTTFVRLEEEYRKRIT